MNSDAIEQIQTKIAFLERANAELSDEVFRLNGVIQVLAARVSALSDRLHSAQSQDRNGATDAERPPHY